MRRLSPDYAVRRHRDEQQAQALREQQEKAAPIAAQARLKAGAKAADATLLTRLQRLAGNRVARRLTQEDGFEAPSAVERELQDQHGRGAPLEGAAKAQMEQGLGADLGAVSIHRDAAAARLTQQLEARAFTHGNDVYFGEGEYAPETQDGRRVLAHELAHVMQQHSGAKLMVGGVNDPAEREADEIAERVVNRLAQGEVTREKDDEEEDAPTLRHQPEEREEEELALPLRRTPKAGTGPGQITNVEGGTQDYDVAGDTLSDVVAALGSVEWGNCATNYTASYRASEGVITAVNITVTTSYRMPRWRGEGYSRASRAAKAEWQRSLGALWTHEHGHRDIGRRYAATIQAGLVGQPEGDFSTLLTGLQAAAQALHDDYDAQTGHGATQGTSIDTSIQ